MGILKNLTFDAVSLSDYGVGLTGSGVYDAPERDVDMIEIPGRNGEYALDKGRYNNIEVTYPAGAYDASQPDFASKISDLRNALASLKGYKRLEDEYNPDEYRLGIFKSGLKVDPVHYSRAGEFDLVFNCKPQRYLKSGETEQTVTSGGTITNPTLFESQPLLKVEGYGKITIDGQEIEIQSTGIGPVTIAGSWTSAQGQEATYTPNLSALASADSFNVEEPNFKFWLYGGDIANDGSLSVISSDPDWQAFASWGNVQGRDAIYIECYAGTLDFIKSTDQSYTTTLTITTALLTKTVGLSLSYSGGNITFTVTTSETYLMQASFRGMEGDSTKSVLGTVYIDCEIGEAYIIDDGEILSANNAVTLPADLPTLKPGANAITYTINVSSLKITPRWWKI